MRKINQANLLKISAVCIAIPRYAGAFMLSTGFTFGNDWMPMLHILELIAGIAMAILEGFAIAFVLNRWRLLETRSLQSYLLLGVVLLIAISLPVIAVPYLFFVQNSFASVADSFTVFGGVVAQNIWNFVVAFAPMLVVVAVGLADVDELAREKNHFSFEQQKRNMRTRDERNSINDETEIQRIRYESELALEQMKAKHQIELKRIRNETKQAVNENVTKPFACPYCEERFEKQNGLNGHIGKCKIRANGAQNEPL